MKLKMMAACLLGVSAVSAQTQDYEALKRLAEQVIEEANEIAVQAKILTEQENRSLLTLLNRKTDKLAEKAKPLGTSVFVRPYGYCMAIPSYLGRYVYASSQRKDEQIKSAMDRYNESVEDCKSDLATDPDYVDPNIAILDVWSDTQ